MPLISAGFIIFLSLSLSAFYLCPIRGRWVVLSVSSILFYAFSGVPSLIFILAVSLSSYVLALIMQKCRKEGSGFCKAAFLCFALALTAGTWMLSRSSGMKLLGISFYSLRVMSYLIEVGRGKLDAQRNALKYLLYTSFFPVATLGPIARYDEMSDSLFSGKGTDINGFSSGVLRLLWGIFKKCVIANLLSRALAEIYGEPGAFSGAYVLFLLIFYSAEIYCDFSGGIDIALGCAKMFGVSLPENFDRPFSSGTLSEFWHRWHITLGEWFERYVFYPVSLSKPMQRFSRECRHMLGAKAGRRIPVYASMMLTWLLTGLWHGFAWHFAAWGMINCALVILSGEMSHYIDLIFKRHPSIKGSRAWLTVTSRIRVFLIIGAVRLLDVYKSLPLTLRMLGTIFIDIKSYQRLAGGGLYELISPYRAAVIAVSLLVLLFVSLLNVKAEKLVKSPFLSAAAFFSLMLCILVFGSYGQGYDSSDFIYSRY